MGLGAIAAAVEELLTRSPTLSLAGLAGLEASRSQVATSRDPVNPFHGVALAGSSDDPLLDVVRSRLASGALFPVGHQSRGGGGKGEICAVCDLTINNPEIEYEVSGGPNGAVFAHIACFLVWRQESEALRLPTDLNKHGAQTHPSCAASSPSGISRMLP